MAKKEFKTNVIAILSQVASMRQIYDSNPELFNIDQLSWQSKATLAAEEPSIFGKSFDFNTCSLQEKKEIINSGNLSVIETLKFTEKELASLGYSCYRILLKLDFDAYIRKDIYKKLSNYEKFCIFKLNPDWVMSAVGACPRLTRGYLQELIQEQFRVFEKYIRDLSCYTTDYYIWNTLISKNSKYKDVFLKNMNTCMTKTDVRSVFHKYPELILKLDSDLISQSKLTSKEWALLISSITTHRHNKKLFDLWTMPEDLVETLKLGVTVEALSGKSKATKRLSGAFRKITGADNEDNGD